MKKFILSIISGIIVFLAISAVTTRVEKEVVYCLIPPCPDARVYTFCWPIPMQYHTFVVNHIFQFGWISLLTWIAVSYFLINIFINRKMRTQK